MARINPKMGDSAVHHNHPATWTLALKSPPATALISHGPNLPRDLSTIHVLVQHSQTFTNTSSHKYASGYGANGATKSMCQLHRRIPLE